jgi:hypothetical protein
MRLIGNPLADHWLVIGFCRARQLVAWGTSERTGMAGATEPRSAVILANPSKSVEWRCTVCCWCAARLSRGCRSDRWTGSALRIYLMRVYNGRLEQAISSGLRDIQPHISKMFGGRGRSRNRTPRPTRL